VALSAAVFRAHAVVINQVNALQEALSKGQTSLQSIPSMLAFPVEIIFDSVKYLFKARTLGPNYFSLSINDQTVEVRVREQPDKSLLCTIGGDNYQLYGQEEALGLRMRINGATVLLPTVFNPSELRSDVTGKVVRFLQQNGDQVDKDQPYVEVEAMKMIMAIKATESGVINHNLSPGSILSPGDLIASLKLKDPSKVKQITTFKGRLMAIPSAAVTTNAESAKAQLSLALDGYDHNVETACTVYLASATSKDAFDFFGSLLSKYIAVEKQFDDVEESSVISQLVKANKDKIAALVPTLLAHKQLKTRTNAVLAILRQIDLFSEKYGEEAKGSNVPAAFQDGK
jgi:acetyl-CoA carboxylase / biotin carboxylase 1